MGLVAQCRECHTPLRAVTNGENQVGWRCPSCHLNYEVSVQNGMALVGDATGRGGVASGEYCPTCGQVMPLAGAASLSAPVTSNVTRVADLPGDEPPPDVQLGVPDGPREPLAPTDASANEEPLEDPLAVGEPDEEVDEPTPAYTSKRGQNMKKNAAKANS